MTSFNSFDYNYNCFNIFSRITFHDWFSSQIHNLVFSVYSRGEWSDIFFIISSFSSTLDDSEACDGDGDTGDGGEDEVWWWSAGRCLGYNKVKLSMSAFLFSYLREVWKYEYKLLRNYKASILLRMLRKCLVLNKIILKCFLISNCCHHSHS